MRWARFYLVVKLDARHIWANLKHYFKRSKS